MSIDIEKAKNDLLTCAALLSTKIRSSDGHGEATKDIVGHYLKRDDVDFAADLADAVADPYLRDGLLIEIAVKCAQLNDDEYSLQLADAVEDFGQQIQAKERIAAVKAEQKNFDKAFEIADELGDPTNAIYAIAIHQELPEALQTIEKIEFPLTKVHALIALKQINQAEQIAAEITFDEEKVRAYQEIAANFIEEKRNDRAIEVLAKSQIACETIQGAHRDHNLAQIALLYYRAGSVDLADRAIDLLKDKYQIASCLLGISNEHFAKQENTEALESLEESYEILKSQGEKEIRNSQARFELFGAIAVRFAIMGKLDKAFDIANTILHEDSRNFAFGQTSQSAIAQGNYELARHALDSISNDGDKAFTLISCSDLLQRSEKPEEAIKLLNEAAVFADAIPQLSLQIDVFDQLARRFNNFHEHKKARELGTKCLENVAKIIDESQKTVSLSHLSGLYDDLSFELTENEREILTQMVRKASF